MNAQATSEQRRTEPPSRVSVLIELGLIASLSAWFVGTFTARSSYMDAGAAVLALALIALTTRRSSAIWRQQRRRAEAPTAARRRASVRAMVAFTGPAVLALVMLGVALAYAQGGWSAAVGRLTNWHIVLAALLYFPWALLQQYIFQFYLLGRLLMVLPPALATGIAALVFSAVHFPRVPVMAVTVIAGLAWALTYRRHGVLWPLAVSHAVLGAALHYFVLDRDLLARWLSNLPVGG